MWDELREQWEEAHSRLVHCYDAQYAVERGTRDVYLCPDCHVELDYVRDTEKDFDYNLTCPKCKKIFKDVYSYNEDSGKPEPMKATINTYYDAEC